MNFTVYEWRKITKANFLRFWSAAYRYNNPHLYDDNIGKELTPDRIKALFCWKNGMVLSGKKLRTVEQNFIQRKGELDAFRESCEPTTFLNCFDEGGATWRIFWLHCFLPNRFPIFDQHVNRAMVYLQTGTLEEIPGSKRVERYVGTYLPFYAAFAGHDRREADKALWAFGRFLKNWNPPAEIARG